MNIEQEANDRWYVQAFNGTPLLLIPCGNSGFDLDELFGEKFQKIMYEFKNDQGKMFYHVKSLELLRDRLFENIRNDKRFLEKLKIRYLKRYGEYAITRMTSDGEPIELLKKAVQALRMSVSQLHIIEPFSLTMDDEIKRRLAKYCSGSELNTKLSVLSAPTEKSFINEKEEDIHRISLMHDGKEKDNEIKKHIEKFHWIRNSYAGRTIMTEADVKSELKTVNFHKIDIDKIKKEKKQLIDKLNLDKELVHILDISNVLTNLQDRRKRNILMSIEQMEQLLEELSTRLNIKHELLRYLSPNEIGQGLFKRADLKQVLEQRRNGVIFFTTPDSEDIVVGEQYMRFIQAYEKNEKKTITKEVNGMCASTGTAVGTVKICTTLKDIAQFKEGDILVTSMTRPEFLPAMKKAAAFVTDEGGLTCHAAIISRELNKPCVIGTKIATKVLKDGDMVEVRANHGLVKIIK